MQTTLKPPKPNRDGKAPKLSKDGKGPLASRNGSVLAAVVTAALAGLIIMVFLNQYRDNVNKDGVPTPVLVAGKLIEQGASGDTIGAAGLFKAEEVPRDQLKTGAVTDAATLRGKVAIQDILPGQQLTAADFRPAGRGVVTKLGPDQRAMKIALDNAHGLIGTVRKGDHVDVLSGFLVDSATGRQQPILRTLMQNLLVLDAPPAEVKAGGSVGGGSGKAKEITLRVTDKQAPKLAFAADNGKLWLLLRPQNGRDAEAQSIVTLQQLLLGSKSVRSGR
ncbi:MAG: Flp pilus assembly protein CpaB [Chloroflexota bacterium]|nr:Flp pilus assembly protein CpaB [Chloroflexota bacterium]